MKEADYNAEREEDLITTKEVAGWISATGIEICSIRGFKISVIQEA